MTAPQTELHRHLDVSIRMSTLLRLSQERGFEPQSTSLESFRNKILIRQPMTDLGTVLAQFTAFQKVLDRPEVLRQVAFEAVEDCWNEGTRAVEFRFSLGFISEGKDLEWTTILDSFEAGIRDARMAYPDIQVGFILIASREYGPEVAAQTVEFALQNRSRIVGVDLAGNEVDFPCRLFEAAFRPARAADLPTTVHAGEASGPENVWSAIEDLGARRIGHGIRSVEDPNLLEYLQKHAICLEVCPTSNWLTQCVPTLDEHPLPQLLQAGVPACINTDDPGIFGVTLPGELDICRTRLKMTEADLALCRESAWKSRFLTH